MDVTEVGAHFLLWMPILYVHGGEYPLLMDVTEVGTHFLLWMPTWGGGGVCKCGEYPLLMDVTEVGTHFL